jgi:hypothetical protein
VGTGFYTIILPIQVKNFISRDFWYCFDMLKSYRSRYFRIKVAYVVMCVPGSAAMLTETVDASITTHLQDGLCLHVGVDRFVLKIT